MKKIYLTPLIRIVSLDETECIMQTSIVRKRIYIDELDNMNSYDDDKDYLFKF